MMGITLFGVNGLQILQLADRLKTKPTYHNFSCKVLHWRTGYLKAQFFQDITPAGKTL
jgi:hypothetical protein